MDQDIFFRKYNISKDAFNQTGLEWRQLICIQRDFEQKRDSLYVDANYVAERLRALDSVHSVKTRVKDPEHLIEKIIRVKGEKKRARIGVENYKDQITDLVGVRAIHLFKDDWEAIHQYILNTWDLLKTPVANINVEDDATLVEQFRDNGCNIYEHPFGYRSVHYVIVFERSKTERIFVEVQVRTILEEAWSEIDHLVRYPYVNGMHLWSPYLQVLNRLTAQADVISSCIKVLKNEKLTTLVDVENLNNNRKALFCTLHNKMREFAIQNAEREGFDDRIFNVEGIENTKVNQVSCGTAQKVYNVYPHKMNNRSKTKYKKKRRS